MASKHREQNIVSLVACPNCGAARGRECFRSAYGPGVHAERRQAWEASKVECAKCGTRHHPGRGPAGYSCAAPLRPLDAK